MFIHRKNFRDITFFRVDSIFKVVFFLYFGYLFVLGFAYEDWKSIRRVFYILLMTFFVFSYVKDLHLKIDSLISYIPVLASMIGMAYIYTYYEFNGFYISYKASAISATQFEFLQDYGNPIIAGLHLAFLVPFCLWSYFNSKNNFASFFYYASVFLILFAVFLTFARTAWLASIIAIIVFVVFATLDKKLNKLILLLLPFIVAVVFYLSNFIGYDLERGVTHRDIIWGEFISSVSGLQQWLFGKGLNQAIDFVKLPGGSVAIHPHSIYVETFYLSGLVGLFLMCSLLFLSIYNLFRNMNDKQSVLWIAVLLSLAFSMAFDFYNLVDSPNIMWLWFWFPVSVSLASYNRVEINKSV